MRLPLDARFGAGSPRDHEQRQCYRRYGFRRASCVGYQKRLQRFPWELAVVLSHHRIHRERLLQQRRRHRAPQAAAKYLGRFARRPHHQEPRLLFPGQRGAAGFQRHDARTAQRAQRRTQGWRADLRLRHSVRLRRRHGNGSDGKSSGTGRELWIVAGVIFKRLTPLIWASIRP